MKKIKAAGFVCLFAVVLVWAVKSGASASATDELSIGQKIDVEFESYIAENEDMRTRDIDQYFSANGNIQQLAKQMDTDSIYAIGDNIIIANDEIEQYEKFYELQGNSAPEEIAIAYAEKRNALYVAAIMNGFSVTDVEIYDYLDELKDILTTTMTEQEYRELISAFESEDAYWNYQFKVYEVNLPIQKYVATLEHEYKSQHTEITDPIALDQAWGEEFERIKEDLVKQQNYVVAE